MATNYTFTKYFHGKGEDAEEAWKNRDPRLDVDYDDYDVDEYENQREREVEEGRITS